MDRAAKLARSALLSLGLLWTLASAPAFAQPGVPNYQGLWWAAPAGSQGGWGINLAHQGDVIYATWFTYLQGNNPAWLAMTANKAPDGSYSGTLVEFVGSSYAAVPFDTGAVKIASFSGIATLSFDSPTSGTIRYDPGSGPIVQPIVLQTFGPPPTCVWGAQTDLTKATNYTDLWWASPPGTESGWGVNLTHQGTTIFATWFTYNNSGTSLWLSATAPQTGPNTFSGVLYRTTGPAWGSLPFDSSMVAYLAVGVASFTFTDGNNGSFTYSVTAQAGGSGQAGGSTQVKPITRQVFRPPGTVCQ